MCDFPIAAYWSHSVNPATGKRQLQFKAVGAFDGTRIDLPCGKCVACRLERSREWAVRLMHENKMHLNSEFVTLTYRNDDLPFNGTLVPGHLKAFHKRLQRMQRGVRYYGCGEYGDLNKRPHYHSILFGVVFPDKALYQKTPTGDLYTSKTLDRLWGLGDAKIAAVTFDTCAYVARYCLKKVDGPRREAGHYQVYDADGVISEREPEFARMSLRPGIGASYFAKFGSEIMRFDNVIMDGKPIPSVRYYDKLIEKTAPKVLKRNKTSRLRLAVETARVDAAAERAGGPRMVSRRATKARLRDLTLKQKKRSL